MSVDNLWIVVDTRTTSETQRSRPLRATGTVCIVLRSTTNAVRSEVRVSHTSDNGVKPRSMPRPLRKRGHRVVTDSRHKCHASRMSNYGATSTTASAVRRPPASRSPFGRHGNTNNQAERGTSVLNHEALAEVLLDPSSRTQYLVDRLCDIDERWEALAPRAGNATLLQLGRMYGPEVVIEALGRLQEERHETWDPYTLLRAVCKGIAGRTV